MLYVIKQDTNPVVHIRSPHPGRPVFTVHIHYDWVYRVTRASSNPGPPFTIAGAITDGSPPPP
jgi:hypothetical protein